MMEKAFTASEHYRDPSRPFEYLVLTVRPDQSLAEARRALAEHAEYGKWELHRSRMYIGGMRRYWLRRRVMRVESTIPGQYT
ncbi:hypothetical protein GCM10023081_28870 [Arthrobacter ginkgonis]|uniref:Uncharacterized protein n=1 Tax=Arthrobacter ginkgonis TaxID=1630594 RepID=A0ABP7CJU9_9MICC